MSRLSKKDRQGIILIAGVILVALGMVAFNAYLSGRPRPDERNCVAPVTAKTVFVIDQSDAIPEQTASEMRSRAMKTVAEVVQANELVSVFVITEQSRTKLLPVFSACKPQQDGSELTENVKAIQRRFTENFQKPFEAALAVAAKKSEASPLGEAIIDLSLSDSLRAGKSRLVLYSDMMQHSENSSLYGCSDGNAAIQSFRLHRAGAVERPTFKNTDVQLNFIPREGVGEAVAACRTRFWAWFFGDNDGANAALTTDYLPGGAKVS
ncbi:hypothetical protein [Novosphingobium sp. PASSN1]|uniref:hypothetical protein n=1 Tax=Novosphingobium sp. PASSN1 TaxID=2015561 RepID=UPI000BD3D2DE|nr:hypothetical protein [Novosphingobium sp. PASSN1]OYU37300.1 MAG: hypothetical protein CFE35_02770 [Novosphingobium sp. PASSN1]